MTRGDTLSSDRDQQAANLASLQRHVQDNRKIVEQQRALVYALHTQGRAAFGNAQARTLRGQQVLNPVPRFERNRRMVHHRVGGKQRR